MMNIQAAVHKFMLIAGQSTSGFNARQAALYTGLQCEELAEKLAAIAATGPNLTLDHVAKTLGAISLLFKDGSFDGNIELADRAELADGDIDLAWVSLGALNSTAIRPADCIAEVGRANLDKFPDGQVLRDANGKVVKPEGWRGPDFTSLI